MTAFGETGVSELLAAAIVRVIISQALQRMFQKWKGVSYSRAHMFCKCIIYYSACIFYVDIYVDLDVDKKRLFQAYATAKILLHTIINHFSLNFPKYSLHRNLSK